MAQTRKYQTNEVIAMTGATAPQLREWLKRGLLSPERTGEFVANNRHLYSDADIEKVRDILIFREMDIGLNEIKRLLEVPEEERAEALVAASEQLKDQYDRLQQRIAMGDAVSAFGIEEVRKQTEVYSGLEGTKMLVQSYMQDENMHMLARWVQSHTERDVEELRSELKEACSKFTSLPEELTWSEVETQLIRFCDVWSKRFGWPSVGQMLQLSIMFSEAATESGENLFSEITDAETASLMSRIFYLAWARASLDCLDNALAHLYKRLLFCTDTPNEQVIQEIAEVFVAVVCEMSCRPHLASAPVSKKRSEELEAVADAVFDLLEEAALGEDLENWLNLDDFSTIDGSTLEAARTLTHAKIRGEIEHWIAKDDLTKWQALANQWITLLAEYIEMSADSSELRMWFDEWFLETYPDTPQAHWATEEEACATERCCREVVEKTRT